MATRIYTIAGPDGRTYDIEGPEGASDAQVIAALQQQLASQPAPKKGILAQGAKGVESLLSSGRTGIAALTGSPEEAALAGLQRGQDISGRYADEIGLDKVKDIYEKKGLGQAAKEVLRQIPLAVAEQLPNIGATLGSARVGAMAGTAVNPGLGTVVGGTVGALAPSLLTQFGGNVERQAAEQQRAGQPVDINTQRALGAAVPQAGLEAASQFIPLGGRMVSKITGVPLGSLFGKTAAQAQKIADERLLTTLLKGTATGVAAELPTEVAQQMLERAQAGLPLTSPDALEEYGHTAYQTALLGPLGIGGRMSEKGGAREQLDKEAAAQSEAARQAAYTAPAEPQAEPSAAVPVPPTETIAEPTLATKAEPPTAPAAPATPAPATLTPETSIEAKTTKPSTEVKTPAVIPLPGPAPEPITEQDPLKLMDMYHAASKDSDALHQALDKAIAENDAPRISELALAVKEAERGLGRIEEAVNKAGGTTAKDFEAKANAERALLDANEKKIKKAIEKAREEGKWDAMPGLAKKLEEADKKRAEVLAAHEKTRALVQVQKTPEGETIPLFGENAPSLNVKAEPLKTEQGMTSEAAAGPLPREEGKGKVDKAALEASQVKAAQAEKELADLVKAGPQAVAPENVEGAMAALNAARQRLRTIQEASVAKPSEALDEAKVNAQAAVRVAQDNLNKLQQTTAAEQHTKNVNAKSEELNNLYDEMDRLRGGKPAPEHLEWADTPLGKQENLLRTAKANGDTRMAEILERAIKKKAKPVKAEAPKTPETSIKKVVNKVTPEQEKIAKEIDLIESEIIDHADDAHTLWEDMAQLEKAAADPKLTAHARAMKRRSYNAKVAAYEKVLNEEITPLREKMDALNIEMQRKRAAAEPQLNAFEKLDKEISESRARTAERKAKEAPAPKKEVAIKEKPAPKKAAPKKAPAKKAEEAPAKKPRAKKVAAYRDAEAAAAGMDKAVVEKLAKEFTATWKRGPEIVVMEAPAEAGNATGAMSVDNRTMYLFHNNLRNDADVKATVFHEGLAHFGLRDLFTRRLDSMMEGMYHSNKNMRMAADAWMREHPEGYREAGENTIARAVEEVLAIHSEAGRQYASTWDKIKSAIKDFARRIGLKLDYTDADIDHILARAHDQLFETGEMAGVEVSKDIAAFRRPTEYKQTDALSELSKKVVAQPKTFKETLGTHYGLEAEMNTVDMRAGLREGLKAGAKQIGDTKLFEQAMYSVTKADQKMPLVLASLSNGPLEMYVDSQKFHGVRSSNKNSAKEVFEAISAIPDSYGDERAKTGLATTYMIAQRAANKGLTALDLGALGVTEAQLEAAMQSVNADQRLKSALENVRTKYNAYNKGMIEFVAASGAISKKTAEAFLKDGDYVPYYRVTENGMAELVFGGEKTINIGDIRHQPYLAELKGGETKILPLNESLPRNTMLLVDKAMTNMATRNVAYALQAYGKTPTGDLMPISRGNGPADPRVIRFSQEPDPKDPKDTGERWLRVVTNDTVLDGIPAELIVKSLEGAHLTIPAFLKYGAVAGDLLRSGVTRTPLYLMRQLFRDPMAATFTTGLDYGPLRAIFKANKEFLDLSTGQSKQGAELIKKGLIQSGIFTGDPDDISKFALQLASGKSMSAIDKLCAMADKAAMNADAATRSLIYENAIKNGLSEVQADMAVMESMNFYKRGLSPSVQYASRLIPFFNAQIQGLNVLYKAARGQMPYNEQLKIKRKFMNNAMMLMGMGMVYAMAMDDDDYYKNAKPKDRYSNFFIHIPGVEEPLKIPVPYEAGWFFSLAVAAVDGMKAETNTEQQLRALKDMFVGAIPGSTSMGVPQIVKPIAEVWTNKNFYSGNSIESEGMRRRDPVARYNASTTEAAKTMAEYIPVLSPVQIEHIVRGYFGQLPIAAMAATNGIFSKDQDVEKPAFRASETPVIGSAFQRKYGGEDADTAFRLSTEAVQAKNTFTELASTGQKEEAKQYMEAHRGEIASAKAATAYEKIMGQYRKQETLIRESKLNEDQKRARLDKLEEAKQKQSERFKNLIEKVEARYAD